MDRPICATCVFYMPNPEKHSVGSCRRNPPQVVFDSRDDVFATRFPPVDDDDWCGAHNKFVQWQLAQPVEGGK